MINWVWVEWKLFMGVHPGSEDHFKTEQAYAEIRGWA